MFVTDKFKELMLEIEALKYKDNQAVNDKAQAFKKSKAKPSHKINREINQPIQPQIKEKPVAASKELLEQKTNLSNEEIIENNLNFDPSKYDESDSSYFGESYIIKHTKKENNNNVNNTVGNTKIKSHKIESYQNNVSSVSFDLNFLKAFECPDYGNECKKVIDKIALDNDVCDQNLAIIILELAELQVYRSNKRLIDDAITLTKRIANKIHKALPSDEGHSLGKILKASPAERMKQLTPIQVLSVSKMLDYLENQKGVYLTNKQEVFSWIEYQLTNPEHHFKGLSFRHALNVISKSLQSRGAWGYSRPYGYVA